MDPISHQSTDIELANLCAIEDGFEAYTYIPMCFEHSGLFHGEDFTISIWGFDILALPCIHNSVHEVIRQVGLLYLWPGKFQIPIIQEGSLQEVTKPAGIC